MQPRFSPFGPARSGQARSSRACRGWSSNSNSFPLPLPARSPRLSRRKGTGAARTKQKIISAGSARPARPRSQKGIVGPPLRCCSGPTASWPAVSRPGIRGHDPSERPVWAKAAGAPAGSRAWPGRSVLTFLAAGLQPPPGSVHWGPAGTQALWVCFTACFSLAGSPKPSF